MADEDSQSHRIGGALELWESKSGSKGPEVTLSVSEGRRWEGSCVLSRRPREIASDQTQS